MVSFDVDKTGDEVDEIKWFVAGGSVLRVWFLWDYPINSFISVYVLYVFFTFPWHYPAMHCEISREIIIISIDFYVYYFVGCVESEQKNWSLS